MEQEKVLDLALPIQLVKQAEIAVFAGITILSFFVPFVLGNPQWVVGTIVNACLFFAALFLPKKYWAPVVILPSAAVLARGLIFGPFTPFLVYFLPFIWLGNFILVLIFTGIINLAILKKIRIAREGLIYFGGVVPASVVKFGFLLLVASLYFKFHLVPKLFLQSMGIFQLYTAIAGGLISFIIFKSYGKFNARS